MTGGWRTAQTEYGDTLQKIAARELQDASRWPEIAWLNELRPPYLTGDPSHLGVVAGRVLLWGGSIRIPTPSTARAGATAAEAFGVDVRLDGGLLSADADGGLAVATGGANLRQALETRLRVGAGELQFHPRYGNAARRIRGRKADHNARLLALRFCEEAVLGDPRVRSVSAGSAEQAGDAIRVSLTAVVDDGVPLRLQVEI